LIPKNILSGHIVQALSCIDNEGVPKGRQGRKFTLRYKGAGYPPKYTVSRANLIVNRTHLDPDTFSGGDESNTFLINLGFEIFDIETGAQILPDPHYLNIARSNAHTNDSRCSECKNTIIEMLRGHYGLVKLEHKFYLSTQLEDYKGLRCYPHLKKIYNALAAFRGFTGFNRAKSLKPCDIYLVEQDIVVELDELQHFSKARAIALDNYPPDLTTGFDRSRWISLAKSIDSKDPDPEDRDEQRAWYDTLRDFLPLIDRTFAPTHRIYTNDFEWCSLNPKNEEDRLLFIDKSGVRG